MAAYLELRTYEAKGKVPADKRFFCLPHFWIEGKQSMTFFTYGASQEEAEAKATEFWEAEIAKARSNGKKTTAGGDAARGRPQKTLVTPAMLKKLDDFDPKG